MKLLVLALVVTTASAITCDDVTPNCITTSVDERQTMDCYNMGTPCEYQVCFDHVYTGSCTLQASWNFGNGFDLIGDMVGEGSGMDEGYCPNEANNDGKGYWDNECTDTSSSMFKSECQNIAAGHTAYFMAYEAAGGACSDGGEISFTQETSHYDSSDPDDADLVTTGYCAPSTSDPDLYSSGQTYFPAQSGTGGTCSGNPEGEECVIAVTVPKYCKYQEYELDCGAATYNDDTVCSTRDSVLDYYENPHNGPPPRLPIHDITQNGDGTVSFGVVNPYAYMGDAKDIHDVYTIYHDKDNGNEQCNKEVSAAYCAHTERITAQCMDDGKWTVVTVFAVGFDSGSGSSVDVAAGGGNGADLYKCCPTSISGNVKNEYTAAWTYLIHCDCPEEEARRGLRVHDDVAEKFHRGELFEDELKQIYGLN